MKLTIILLFLFTYNNIWADNTYCDEVFLNISSCITSRSYSKCMELPSRRKGAINCGFFIKFDDKNLSKKEKSEVINDMDMVFDFNKELNGIELHPLLIKTHKIITSWFIKDFNYKKCNNLLSSNKYFSYIRSQSKNLCSKLSKYNATLYFVSSTIRSAKRQQCITHNGNRFAIPRSNHALGTAVDIAFNPLNLNIYTLRNIIRLVIEDKLGEKHRLLRIHRELHTKKDKKTGKIKAKTFVFHIQLEYNGVSDTSKEKIAKTAFKRDQKFTNRDIAKKVKREIFKRINLLIKNGSIKKTIDKTYLIPCYCDYKGVKCTACEKRRCNNKKIECHIENKYKNNRNCKGL